MKCINYLELSQNNKPFAMVRLFIKEKNVWYNLEICEIGEVEICQ